MKKMAIAVINFYQLFLSAAIKNILGVNRMCRYSPTCSEYAKKEIASRGLLRGTYRSFKRLMRCQPFAKI